MKIIGNIILRTVDPKKIGNNLFFMFSVFGILLSILTIIISKDVRVTIAVIAFNLLVSFINNMPLYRRIPGSIILSFNVAIFYSLPMVYISYKYSLYDFTLYFGAPGPNSIYFDALPVAIWFLIISLIMLYFGMFIGDSIKINKSKITMETNPVVKPYKNIGRLLFITLFVVFLAIRDSIDSFNAISNASVKNVNLLAFLFNDRAFFLICPFVFYSLGHNPLNRLKYKIAYLFLFLMYNLVLLQGTSKGAILNSFEYLFLYPLAFYYNSNKKIYWPSWSMFFFLFIMIVPLFVYGTVKRQNDMQGLFFNIDTYMSFLNKSLANGILQQIEVVFCRLSSSFQNYVIIFTHFFENYSAEYALHYAVYVFQAFLNIVLPGTPFPNAYIPSSQLLNNVLMHEDLIGFGDSYSFWAHANTQPYTIFGVLFILFGPFLTIPALIVLGYMFTYAYNYTSNKLFRVLLLTHLSIILHIYGIETSIQITIHAFIVGLIVTYIMNLPNFKIFIKKNAHFVLR